jgi:ABC-type sugar transport system ATPase subunit
VAGFLNRHVGTPPINLIDARYLASGGPLGDVQVGIRPEDVVVSRDDRADGIAGTVAGKLSLPMLNATVLSVRVDQHEIFAHIGGDENVRAGDRVWLTFRKYHLFDRPSGRRLGSHAEPAPA